MKLNGSSKAEPRHEKNPDRNNSPRHDVRHQKRRARRPAAPCGTGKKNAAVRSDCFSGMRLGGIAVVPLSAIQSLVLSLILGMSYLFYKAMKLGMKLTHETGMKLTHETDP